MAIEGVDGGRQTTIAREVASTPLAGEDRAEVQRLLERFRALGGQ
jgi:hypothetical protein